MKEQIKIKIFILYFLWFFRWKHSRTTLFFTFSTKISKYEKLNQPINEQNNPKFKIKYQFTEHNSPQVTWAQSFLSSMSASNQSNADFKIWKMFCVCCSLKQQTQLTGINNKKSTYETRTRLTISQWRTVRK